MATSNGGSEQGGSGYAGGGIASPNADSKVGLIVAIVLGVLVVAGGVVFYFVK